MIEDTALLPGRLLRRVGPPKPVRAFQGVQIDEPRLAEVLCADAPLLCLYEGTLHSEGPVWVPKDECLYWSDVPNRRLLKWQSDGQVTVAIDGTYFMNGNALDPDGRLVHCEHGRRCISRSDGSGTAEPIVTHFEGKRLNSPNDIAVAADGAIWFTDPIFGLLMPSQGSLADPELDHRSVYRLDPATEELRRMADFEQPNGLFFSPDGRTLYVSDTALSLNEIPGPQTGRTHEIQAFDVAADGSLFCRRFFCHTDHGYPDGFVVDGRGWVWTTAGDGIHIIAPDRTPLGYIPTPTVCSNCKFGGPGMTRLFIAATNYLLAIDLIPER
ncbi:MAG: SMP-30/gluconolactonase/LRE family protein [Steroidobacteraceae bacterium]